MVFTEGLYIDYVLVIRPTPFLLYCTTYIITQAITKTQILLWYVQGGCTVTTSF
jgi:hypothetical protein